MHWTLDIRSCLVCLHIYIYNASFPLPWLQKFGEAHNPCEVHWAYRGSEWDNTLPHTHTHTHHIMNQTHSIMHPSCLSPPSPSWHQIRVASTFTYTHTHAHTHTWRALQANTAVLFHAVTVSCLVTFPSCLPRSWATAPTHGWHVSGLVSRRSMTAGTSFPGQEKTIKTHRSCADPSHEYAGASPWPSKLGESQVTSFFMRLAPLTANFFFTLLWICFFMVICGRPAFIALTLNLFWCIMMLNQL